jgi:1-phosphofructokinase
MNPDTSATPHVFTLTGNLLAERTLEYERWQPGKTQRAASESFQVGGKGINVSKMLTRLAVPNTALCFVGGSTGAECATWLRDHGFVHRAFSCAQPTRAGTVVRDRSGTHAETTFLGPDAVPDPLAVRACAEFLEQQPDGQILAICGSVPGWASDALLPLRDAIDRWATRGVLVVDTYGPPLVTLAQRPLALLKINADELRSLTVAHIGEFPRPLRSVVVTDGPREILARDAAGALSRFDPPVVREISATGSGDVFLAGLIHALFVRGRTLPEAIAFAKPLAAANAAHPGIAEFPLPAEM